MIIRKDGRVDDIILVGDEVVLYCDITLKGVVDGSDVIVDVSWFKDNDPFNPFNEVITSNDEDAIQSKVTFSHVHISDRAVYICQVIISPLYERLSESVTTRSKPYILAVLGMQ